MATEGVSGGHMWAWLWNSQRTFLHPHSQWRDVRIRILLESLATNHLFKIYHKGSEFIGSQGQWELLSLQTHLLTNDL